MGYRTILVELEADRPPAPRLKAARALALRCDAALIGMHVMPKPFVPVLWEGAASVYLVPEVIEGERKVIREVKEQVRAVFDEICGSHPAMSWREAEGEPGLLLAEAACSTDLLITAKGQAGADETHGLIERLIMAAGVPVLVLPPTWSDDLGQTVLAGWDGSREATRAVHAALPFLREAKHVVLCAVAEEAGASLEDATTMLRRHGVPVHPESVAGSDRNAGEMLLERAAAHGARLLVMGAYGHTRLREFIFGGATRHVLHEATLPVLFSG